MYFYAGSRFFAVFVPIIFVCNKSSFLFAMFYLHVVCISKGLYHVYFCRSEVIRYKPPCFGMLLLSLRVRLLCCPAAGASAALHRLVCVYVYDFRCYYPKFLALTV